MSKTSTTASRQRPQADGAGVPPTSPRPLPVDSLEQALAEFRRPFHADAVKWKVQTELANQRGLLVAYVDARLIYERLNLVAGGNWEHRLEECAGGIKCTLTVFGKSHEDIGEGGFAKASASDAVKRAAVPFGIGASLYAIPTRVLESDEKGGTDTNDRPRLKRVKDKRGNTRLYITDQCEAWLRVQYDQWVKTIGVARFGDPFDHGSAIGTVGDAAEGGVVQDVAETDDSAVAERKAAIRKAYDAAVAAGAQKSKMPKRQFEVRLNADLTPEELDELEADIAKFRETATKE